MSAAQGADGKSEEREMAGGVWMRGDVRRGMRRGALACALCTLLATLALAGCGAGTQPARGGASGEASGGTPTGAIPGGGMAVRPCPGQVSDATQFGPLALILTPDHLSGALRVGEFAQARLPANLHWTLTAPSSLLGATGPAGGQDSSLNVCYWTFRAQQTGSATLTFSGVQPCDPPAIPCSDAVTRQTFTITVS